MDTQSTPYKSASSYKETLMFSIFLGWLGIDRFYMGDISLGILKLMTFGGGCIWWLVDVCIIASHKSDWDAWMGARKQREVNNEIRKAQQAQQMALEKERAANGHCPKCDSDRLQAVGKTSSKQSIGSGNMLVDMTSNFKYNATHQKIQTKMVRVCLNCGYEF